ncbi:MAG: hypothetical protein V3T27_00650 [Alphaproteobacteria bacterium]
MNRLRHALGEAAKAVNGADPSPEEADGAAAPDRRRFVLQDG